MAGTLVAMAACTKVEDAGVSARKAVEAARPSATAPAARAPSGLEAMVRDLESCPLEGYQISSTCEAMETLSAELRHLGAPQLSVPLGKKLLADRAPAVRLQAAAMLGHDGRDAIVDAARRETDPRVREAMIRTLASESRDLRVATFLLESTQHPIAEVRAQALAALTRPESRTVPGAVERVRTMAERDPDPQLRQAACASAGKLGDPSLVAFYERATATADDPELYAACMEGVVALLDTPNEGAYRLFLARIAATPRTEQSPPWQVMSAFCYGAEDARRAPWFDPAAVKAALAGVITDRDASWKARAAAVESMVGLGATKAELAPLEASYTAKASPKASADQRVLASLDSALAE